MATSTRHLCRCVRQISRTSYLRPKISQPQPQQQQQQQHHQRVRLFTSSTLFRADESSEAPTQAPTQSSRNNSKPGQSEEVLEEDEFLTPDVPYTAADLDPRQRADFELLSKTEQAQYLKLENHFKAIFESKEMLEDVEKQAERIDREMEREHGQSIALDFPTTRAKGVEVGYWAEDEEDEFGQMEDADDAVGDDYVSAVAESQLDLHRDIREYTRIAAWDLPLLQQYAKPFSPPNHSTPLRFRYTTYMGEAHPAASKVVVEFSTKDLLAHPSPQYKLSESQRQKLIKLVGVRYNPTKDIVKISSEKFDSAAQNKRYLGDLIGTLLKEAKDKRDEFKDVPFDFRHHKEPKKAVYPESWKLRSQTIKLLAQRRQELQLIGEEEIPVNGDKLVEEHVRVKPKEARLLQ